MTASGYTGSLISLADVDGLAAALAAKADAPILQADVDGLVAALAAKLSSPIAQSDVSGLTAALASKLSSPIAQSDVTGLVTALAGKLSSPAAITDVTNLQAALTPYRAADHNLTGWTFDPIMVQGGTVLATAGLSYVFRIRALSTTITNIHVHLTAGGSSLTSGQCFASLHNDAGAILGAGAVTASLHSTGSNGWGDGGYKTHPLTTPQAVTQYDWYRVRLWFNGTTGPTLSRALNSNTVIVNAGLSAPNFRYATADSGLTTSALAPGTIGTQTGANTAWWMGLS